MQYRLAGFILLAGMAASAQTLSNKSLTGKYFFREVAVAPNGQVQSLFGTLTFDGNTPGGFAFAGQQLTGNSAAASANGNGAYTVQSGGLASMSDPLRSGAQVNLRLGATALVGSNTENAGATFSILVAAPAPATAVTSGTVSGTYWMASLEFLNGVTSSKRQTFFPVTANGGGSFGDPTVWGEASNLGDRQIGQSVPGSSYSVSADGTGIATFPIPSAKTAADQLIGGTKIIYSAQDGSFFFGGGSTSGGQGLVIAVKAAPNATASILSGPYVGAALSAEFQSYTGFAGTANALGDGRIVWSRRLVQSGSGAEDITSVSPYTISPDASGSLGDRLFGVSANGQMFVGSGLAATSTLRYELLLGVRAAGVSGSGLSLNPQGVFNVFSFAPNGNPIAPGEFITIYGTGFPSVKALAPPFPTISSGVQLLINNTPAPLYTITPTQVFAVVPYSIRGPTATIVFNNNGPTSNTIIVPVVDSAPGIATVAQNGLGPGAITHANGSLVTAASPASRGETVVIYLTGLGQVTPAVRDGFGATGLSSTNSVLAVYFNGVCGSRGLGCDASNVLYQGLTPGYPGLYQINVTIPRNLNAGPSVPVAIQTASGFTDMVDIAIQ